MTATIAALVREASERLRVSGSETALLDAELLLGHVLGVERTTVLAHPETPVGDGQAAAFRAAVARREGGEPIAYIRGLKEFHGLAFVVDARALIPRPETELLVDLALDRVREALTDGRRPAGAPTFLVWDVGTGSGAIVVALARALRRRGYGDAVRFTATDVSADALALAVENAVAHGVADGIVFAIADLLAVDAADAGDAGRADLIVANLPYIPSDVVPALPVAASFEPRVALDGGPDGLALVRRLLEALAGALAPGGRALLEIGSDQAGAVAAAADRALPGWRVTIHADLSGSARIAEVAHPGAPVVIAAGGTVQP